MICNAGPAVHKILVVKSVRRGRVETRVQFSAIVGQ